MWDSETGILLTIDIVFFCKQTSIDVEAFNLIWKENRLMLIKCWGDLNRGDLMTMTEKAQNYPIT